MDIQGGLAASRVTDQRSFSTAVNISFSTGLTLQTREGDRVNLSFDNRQSLTESGSQTRYAGGETVQEFSSAAVAASRYSLSVQGDLNSQELDAIQKLVQDIGPIARKFFTQSEFDPGITAQVLSNSLGTISEVELSLERVITATISAQSFSSQPARGTVDAASPAANPVPNPVDAAALGGISSAHPGSSASNIRDLPALVLASVEAEFEAQAGHLPQGERILRSLNDLMQYLQKQLSQFLAPLQNSAEPDLKPLPQGIENGSSSGASEA
ncbi:MAG: hypothetical protein ACE5E9_04200 [Nitrospinaceae bacterium]